MFQVDKCLVPMIQPSVGSRATEECFGKFGISPESKPPLDDGFVDRSECDQTGSLVNMDTVQGTCGDGLIEIIERAAMISGGGTQLASELEQARFVQLNRQATVDVLPGSVSVAAAEPYTGADEKSSWVIGGEIDGLIRDGDRGGLVSQGGQDDGPRQIRSERFRFPRLGQVFQTGRRSL
jgi:hypothetical protein